MRVNVIFSVIDKVNQAAKGLVYTICVYVQNKKSSYKMYYSLQQTPLSGWPAQSLDHKVYHIMVRVYGNT